MNNTTEIVSFLNRELRQADFKDSSLNGLQFEGTEKIEKIAVSVDAGLAIIEEAVQAKAQMLIVHHGVFWGQAAAITGPHKNLVKTVLDAGLNLFAAHLPLDSHMTYGNNIRLAEILELTNATAAFLYNGNTIGCIADNSKKKELNELVSELEKLPGKAPITTLPFGPTVPKRIGIISGAGATHEFLSDENVTEFDTFITGEPRQSAYHFARERSMNMIFAGHYRTETLGVCELGKAIEAKFGIPWEFIDHPTGI